MDKTAAHDAVRKAVFQGILTRPNACEHCGKPPSTWALSAHHHNGYDDDHVLDVEWLCAKCHVNVHNLPARMQSTTAEQRSEVGRRAGEVVKSNRTREEWAAMGRKGGPAGGRAFWDKMTPEEREYHKQRVTTEARKWHATSTHAERSAASHKGWETRRRRKADRAVVDSTGTWDE